MAQYFVGYITMVPNLSRWVPFGFPEVTRDISGCVVLLLNRAERDYVQLKGGISVRGDISLREQKLIFSL